MAQTAAQTPSLPADATAPPLASEPVVPPPPGGHDQVLPTPLPLLALAALGVVYGDIGTSPLYAVRECFSDQYGMAVTRANVFGLLSLILWSLVLVVAVKYIVFILRADNKGEGGILALMALVLQ